MHEACCGRLTVSLVALPDSVMSTLSGLYDVFGSFDMLRGREGIPDAPPFRVEIVAETAEPVMLASGLPVVPHRAAGGTRPSDIVIVPSIVLGKEEWRAGRYPRLTEWLLLNHARGASICSACSGLFLIAETGLFDGHEATVHWPYARAFSRAHPQVSVAPERALVVSGARGEMISSGAASSWHDLALYLIGRHAGPPAAQAVASFYALQPHHDGLAPFIAFDPPRDHGDAAIAEAQAWLARNAAAAIPVRDVVRRSGLSERSFSRRFREVTATSPLEYVQRLRVEDAKRRLERTDASVEEIAWRVGYEDPAAFRRLFKRVVGVAPGLYRRRYSVPAAAHGARPHWSRS